VVNASVIGAGLLTLLAVFLISRGTGKPTQTELLAEEAEAHL
jgi:hypothetical protein